MSNGELVLQNGGTVNGSSVQLSASKFKPTGTVSVTNGGSLNFNELSSVVLQGDTTLTQSSPANWSNLDLNGNKLTLNVSEMKCCKDQAGGLTIKNGEAITSFASSDITVQNKLTIANGGKLSSGTGNTTIQEALTLNGEIEQGGGILNLTQGGTVGATGKLLSLIHI